MKIQLLTIRNIQNALFPNVTISDIGKPRSLDEFEINIIDLGSERLWKTTDYGFQVIDRTADIHSLQSMVSNREHSIVIYLLPQDVTVCSDRHPHTARLKDCAGLITTVLQTALPSNMYIPRVFYEPTKTKVGEEIIPADFYFDELLQMKTASEASNKPTSVENNCRIYLTTLSVLETEKRLFEFLICILPKPEKEVVPEWMREIEFFDDREQKNTIERNKQAIENAQKEIEASKTKLETNMYYKSILYSNGAELVEVVFSILERILSCDLSEFRDEKKEDFLIKKSNYTIIGEIKGVSSNIKNEHISQVDVHYQGYMDSLAETGRQENVHQVLIINPFRNKPISDREPVHETQVKLAERNGCLIIETLTLLKLFEKLKNGEINVSYCETLFTTRTGLLTL